MRRADIVILLIFIISLFVGLTSNYTLNPLATIFGLIWDRILPTSLTFKDFLPIILLELGIYLPIGYFLVRIVESYKGRK